MKFKYQQPEQTFRQKPTTSQPAQPDPVVPGPITGGGTPIPYGYDSTATDPLYGTSLGGGINFGGNTYTQTGGLLSILEVEEQQREVQRQVDIQRAVQKSIQDDTPPPKQVDNTQMIAFVLMGLLIGYLAYPLIKSWTN